MKNVRQFIDVCFVCTTLSMFSCMDHDIGGGGGTPVDSVKVIASLTAPGRYWVLEKITRTVGGRTEDVSEYTMYFDSTQIFYSHFNAYQFLGGASRTFFEFPQELSKYDYPYDFSGGLSGNRPYGIADLAIRLAFIAVGPFHGTWAWDNSKQTFSVTHPYLFWKSTKGYLDPDMFPKYNNLTEAQNAGLPERIRIVLGEIAEADGNATYAYTLRAAWIIRSEPSTVRYIAKYIVVY